VGEVVELLVSYLKVWIVPTNQPEPLADFGITNITEVAI
jgi:hypothetical protein